MATHVPCSDSNSCEPFSDCSALRTDILLETYTAYDVAVVSQELREMAGQMPAVPTMRRRNTMQGPGAFGDSHLKVELLTLQKKYDRLEKKEKRIQVRMNSSK